MGVSAASTKDLDADKNARGKIATTPARPVQPTAPMKHQNSAGRGADIKDNNLQLD